MEWSEGGRKWDNCNSIINKYILKNHVFTIGGNCTNVWSEAARPGFRVRTARGGGGGGRGGAGDAQRQSCSPAFKQTGFLSIPVVPKPELAPESLRGLQKTQRAESQPRVSDSVDLDGA